MKTEIKKWGNSQGIMLQKSLLDSVNLHVGDTIDISVDDQKIIIKKIHPHLTLRERFAEYKGDYQPTEWETGKTGKEVF